MKITTTISSEFFHKAVEHKISWAEAMRRGIKSLLDEKEGKHLLMCGDNKEYAVPLQVALKVQKLTKLIGEMASEREMLKQKNEEYKLMFKRGKNDN